MRPMLATRGDRVPSGPDWVHEIKWDGMRVLLTSSADRIRLFSRNENDVTVSFPEVAGLRVPPGTVLDGEVVALQDGRPSFAALADRMHVQDARRAARLASSRPVRLILFDLLEHSGQALLDQTLARRRELLERLPLDGPDGVGQLSPTYDDGPALMAAAREQGLEGVVSKRLASHYHPGRRSRDWLKFPIRPTGSFVVGGYRHETGSRSRLGALLVGSPARQGLHYRGKVGSGVAGRAATRLATALAGHVAPDSPFLDQLPVAERRGTVWVDPVLVVDVEYLLLTEDGRLRQPAYRGLRGDLSPDDLAHDDLEH